MNTDIAGLSADLNELLKTWKEQIDVDPTDAYDEGYSTAKHECFIAVIALLKQHGPQLLSRAPSRDEVATQTDIVTLIDAKLAQDALEQDAARYRWLRENDNANMLAEDVIDDAIAAAEGENHG